MNKQLSVVISTLCLGFGLAAPISYAVDNGSQINAKFRINYAGYLPQANKMALYLSNNNGSINWQVSGTQCAGTEDTYINNDLSSGDSFYQIDFSACVEEGQGLRLVVGADQSAPFNISNDPYGNIKYEFFDYFKDHEGSATFSNAKNNWATGLSINFSYVKDAGDNGAYPTNTAEAAWSLINLLETYPAVNTYYSNHWSGARTVYQQLLILTEQFDHVFDHGGPLAIAKFHTNVNSSWAACAPHTSGTCISEPETKATFAAARTLAAMARLHQDYASTALATAAYNSAKSALIAAQNEPLVCNQQSAFGGEGGMYPDNDNYSIYRNPKTARDNCSPDKDNTADDEYAALVETYLAALKLGFSSDAANYRSQVINHARFAEASSFWWGAVSMEGNLSLLTHAASHTIDLAGLKANILNKADAIKAHQALGYPGVTWDPASNVWDNGDQDNADNNVRWGSHRMALNDARILMAASEIQKNANQTAAAASYARSAIQVLDHISGINAMNLAMFTAPDYPQFENAVERTHDGANNSDSWSGKLVLGPNNWTNADDGAMPAFNSQPGLKMFAMTGTGWSSREISIDANAALVPVAYFTTEIAPAILALDPLGNSTLPANAPAAPSSFTAVATGANAVALSWVDNAGANDDAETGFYIYQNTVNTKPANPTASRPANASAWSVAGLAPQTTYYFWLEAFNNNGASPLVATNGTTDDQPAFTNLLDNGDFNLGAASWLCTIPSGTASCSVNAGEYGVNIQNGGSSAWHIQPKQEGLSLSSGQTYTFAFDARASSSRNAEIKVERAGSPWEDFSQTGAGQSLNSSMQRFSYTFSMPTSLNNARVVMNVGNSNSSVVVDNLWLVAGAVDPCGGIVGCSGGEEPIQHEIVVSTGSNGSVSPGTIEVPQGQDQTFTIAADNGYHVLNVVKNGVSLGAVTSVAFTDVSASQTLAVTFEQDSAVTHTIAVNAGANGVVSPASAVVNDGGSATFTITPNAGFHTLNVMKNGVSLGAVNSVSFANVTANQTLSATFEQDAAASYSVAVSAGANGSISPVTATVEEGGSETFTFTANSGYRIAEVLVNGQSVGQPTSHTLENVTSHQTISATFEVIPTGGNGPCANYCSNPVTVTSGQNNGVGTGEVCHEINSPIQGGGCYNLSSPRQLSVNGEVMSCNSWNVPAPENGGYCVQITAGGVPWAGYSYW